MSVNENNYYNATFNHRELHERLVHFYDNYVALCNELGKSPSGVALEVGLSKTAVNGWKHGRSKPTDATLHKLANYFSITVDELLRNKNETAPAHESERKVSDDDIKFALFGGDGEITDAMYEEVKRFAQMVKLREEAERKKE